MNALTLPARPEHNVEISAAQPSQYLAFELQREMYLLPLRHVREIIQYRAIVAVPKVPACVCGIINLRGNVIPVIDLATRFGGVACQPDRRAVILILELETATGIQRYGAIADSVSEVLALAAADIGPAPTFGPRVRTDFIAGVATRDQTVMLSLDVETLLTLE